MNAKHLFAITALLGLTATAHADSPAQIRAYGGGGAYGGCTTCLGKSYDEWNQHAVAGASVGNAVSSVGGDGSYADASGAATLGHLHAYADAHRTYNDVLYGSPYGIGDAQASDTSSFTDQLLPAANNPSLGYANYMLTLNVSGTHTAVDTAYPQVITAEGSVGWDVRDTHTGEVYAHGTWDSSDANPGATLQIAVLATHPNDPMTIDVSLATYAYVMSNNSATYLTAVADYHDTLDVYLDALTPGASTLGASGHDYAMAAAVPEPSSAALWFGGMVFIGLRWHHRRGR